MKLLFAFVTALLAMAALYAGEDTITTTSFPGSTLTTSVGATSTDVEFTATAITLIMDGTTTTWTATGESTSLEVIVSGTTTTLSVDGTTEELVLKQDTTVDLTLAGLTTTWVVGDASADVAIDGTATTITVTGSTSTQWIVSPTATEVTYSGTTITFTTGDGTTESTVIFEGTTVSLALEAATASLSLYGTEVSLAYEGIEATLTIAGSEESSSSSTEEESSTTDESSTSEESSTEESSTAEESSTISEESSTTTEESTTESTSEESTTEESTAFGESSTTSEESSGISGTTSSPTAPAPMPTSNPTYCEVVRGPLTPEEEAQLQVLFSDRAGASAFADYVVSYASQLVAQIADVANIAVGDNNYAFATAFNTINIPGILGLASAAPIYTCFLSSLWVEALSNPQQYAKRAVPTQDEKIKLIVLFEKRENSGMGFDYAELLIDETNDLIAEVQNVSAAAANGDLGAYASLFANVDVPYLLSIATEAPIYTEGLSAALQTALASYSESAFRPTVTTMTTRTYTTVNTIVTNFVNGTVTAPTTIVSTETVVTVEPIGQVQATSTALQAAPAPTANAPVNKVTTEVVTLGNGRVETRTVTICVENCDTVVAESTKRPAAVQTVTTRPNVAVYTQVQNGVTHTHTIEIQTKNAALKKVAALGAGILGGAALLL